MIQKRVLIGSFILIIAGLFFIVGTDPGITGAAIGISTSALDSASSPLFGFFLIWIASFMLIVSTGGKINLETLLRKEKEIAKGISEEEYQIAEDYVLAVGSFKKKGKPKKYKDLKPDELKKVAKIVRQYMIKRHYLSRSKGLAESYEKAITSKDEGEIKWMEKDWVRDSGLKEKEDLEILAKGGGSIKSFYKLSEKAGEGMKETKMNLLYEDMDYEDIKKILQGISEGYKKIGSEKTFYKPEEFKDEKTGGLNIGKLKNVYKIFKQDIGSAETKKYLGADLGIKPTKGKK